MKNFIKGNFTKEEIITTVATVAAFAALYIAGKAVIKMSIKQAEEAKLLGHDEILDQAEFLNKYSGFYNPAECPMEPISTEGYPEDE